ncbi:hypothetical protein GCM10023081_31640 [Arthrobacter ginkgonis]|uniref:HTH marR-type domain-containing protein n=1 Tax=Arthrobacter ginkgonis TaxID=1630594 RepID=A0ABP7CJK1_9MICC
MATEPESAEMSGLIEEVERQFSAMFLQFRTAMRERAAHVHPDLPPIGFSIMTLLAREGNQQQVELAHRLVVDKGAVSRTVKLLESFGLVLRAPDPHDGRAHLVGLSEEGRRRYDDVIVRQRKILHERLGLWDPEEVRHFGELLAKLNESY